LLSSERDTGSARYKIEVERPLSSSEVTGHVPLSTPSYRVAGVRVRLLATNVE
jgi:hypothetical protein